ncbi:oxidoreductase [Agaricicola taiwanensis]|uniref:Oxidoreductase n=1 Tax=Agaricicola taiwanensis TaxID=591372 RepID=A0A8J2VR98_9RHOB|nr:NAD(P)-dependent oxidoreductase [Agaricicola taiwanensis]GGE38498.1 oxidoreductase [Agaricicola taiwanensis]
MHIGFIGLGKMGVAMARNLAKAGHRVSAWNRSPVTEVIDDVDLVASPAEAFQAEAVFTMLSDDASIRQVVLEADLLAHAPSGCVHVVTSTISTAFADELARAHEAAGVAYVSAPVFGRPDVAAAGALNVVAAGRPEAIARVEPLFDVIGQKTWVMGEDPKQANAAKIGGNMMISMAIEAMAEGLLLTGAHGVKPEAFLELMTGTLFGSRAYQSYAPKIASGDFTPGFRMTLGLKDLRLATEAAQAAGRPTPMLDAVATQMEGAVEAGLGDKDWSAVTAFTRGLKGA